MILDRDYVCVENPKGSYLGIVLTAVYTMRNKTMYVVENLETEAVELVPPLLLSAADKAQTARCNALADKYERNRKRA